MYKYIASLSLFLFTCVSPISLKSQELLNPFDYAILLSGNFGELRTNHFHAGIDFKTKGAEGKPVHAVTDGYISRVSVSPGGYGNGLYLTHADGTTTVYGHLQRFLPAVADYVKEEQYAQESFSVNLYPEADRFPVKKGELIAWSGNTGSSGGPHLHFEVRDTKSEELLDPILFYKKQIRDTRPPRIQGVMLYPVEGEGVVNGKKAKQEFKKLSPKDGKQTLTAKLTAWGRIGVGVKAYDYMDDTHHVYGVKEIVLKVDGDTVFHSYIDRYALNESRYLNSFVDYADWIDNRSFYMKSFIEPGNKLRFIKGKDRGYLTIDEERPYLFEYILTDAFGNSAYLEMQIEGKEQPIPAPETEGRELFSWRSENKFGAKGIRLTIPKGNLYDSFYFKYTAKEGETDLSDIHQLHNTPVALHQNAQLSLRLLTDSLENKTQYGIVHLHKGRRAWIGGTYRNGWIDATIRELGQYSLAVDTVPPTITPIDPATWKNKRRFVFRLSDNLSGIKTYRGEIDGTYALFTRDNRSVITYHFDRERLLPGEHSLRLTVQDGCGNETVYTQVFIMN
ncbi:M23 family metallopeptidase [Parabacteroides sp. PF5-6]|uniref:M23 family metallopeptidase n=1 Tax=Parabacteroides sp. PF5-6 TaxID=1742403 RepID=UPI0024075A9E|nr:M23 family metallopeptidase [Parabacteroides sp. PF5-6]MDF9830334.1 murein DD-endopeptidase MepM/ murein hydrolase activator NlpD [Parabacteroides sp. PF5-6]